MWKILTVLGIIIAGAAAFFFLLAQPNPHITLVSAVKKNCFDLMEAVEIYKDKYGQYPSSWKQIQLSNAKNPVNSSDDWIRERAVPGREEALEFAQQADPGQVVFCPLRINGAIVDFNIMGMDETKKLVPNSSGGVLVLGKDHSY